MDAAEAALGVRLPAGYRELLIALQQSFQQVVREAWYFDEPGEALTQDVATGSVMIADPIDGDQVILHPAHLRGGHRPLGRRRVVPGLRSPVPAPPGRRTDAGTAPGSIG